MPMAGSSGNGSQLKVNKLKTYIWELVPLGLQIACNSTRGWNVPKGIQEAHSAPPLANLKGLGAASSMHESILDSDPVK